ncbi:MAG TPA: spherulation-specific family 4 protein [Gemmataceae bacterium]|nr:spherulation-specific family 4 protein [Gemmataceae bacterium]
MRAASSLVVAALALLALTAGASAEAPRLRLLVPAYFYPAGNGLRQWDRLIAAASRAPVVAVVDPDSGPGKAPDPNYVAVLDRARRAGVTLVGYVSTHYTERPLAGAKADVDRWVQFYPQVQGIFADEQNSGATKVGYYAELYEHARKKISHALVLTNPGTPCAPEYLAKPATDTACLYERDKGFPDFRMPDWTKRYAADRFAVVVYRVPDADTMRAYVRQAARQGIGNVYFTDAGGGNPYDRLPPYWDEEVRAVERCNREAGR